MAKTQSGDVTVFKSGGALKTMLTISFAFLLFFVANSIAGAVWLAVRNLWTDAGIFIILFGIGVILILLNAIFLFAASHVEVRMEPDKTVMTLPNWRGPTPLFPYTQMQIPYKDIAGVETRREIYRYFNLPVVVHHSSFIRKDGKRFTLGYMRESSEDHAVPYREIAAELARRAGVGVIDRGIIEAGSREKSLLKDEPPWDVKPVDESQAAAVLDKEDFFMKAASVAFIVFVVGGLIYQIARIFVKA